jgi:two-component system chemotaxis sensor kinase CheA
MDDQDAAYAALSDTLRLEAAEQTERIGAALLELEAGAGPERTRALVDGAFRDAHNLKGAAGSLGFTLTARLAHVMESALALLRSGAAVTELPLDALHQGLSAIPAALAVDPGATSSPVVDRAIEALGAALRAPPPPSGAQPPSPSQPQSSAGIERSPSVTQELERVATSARGPVEETRRVSTRKLGALMAQVGELLAARLRTDQRLAELRAVLAGEEDRLARRTLIRQTIRDQLSRTPDRLIQRMAEAQAEGLEHQKVLVRSLRELVRSFEADALETTILSGALQEDIRRIQTLPLGSVLEPLPRAVRNLAREAGKAAELVIVGAELELDKKVLDEIKDPLTHLLRNAVDHGVEPPEARRAAGKPERARLVLTAEHQGNVVVIRVADDGPGVDLAAVRRAAVEHGLVTAAEAAELPEGRVLELLFAPGLTTRAEATALSGRGVGLDAVREAIERLHGTVTVESRAGRGATVVIALPLTIYVVHAIILRLGEQRFALPISAVHRILRVSAGDVLDVEGTSVIIVEGRPVPLLDLAALLGIDSARAPLGPAERMPVLVVGTGDARCALVVDELVGDQTLLAKNLEPPLVRVRNFAGASILGDGTVILMLNPIDLLRAAAQRGRPYHAPWIARVT